MAKIVLISGFDPFLGGAGNNSTVIGEKIERRFQEQEIKIIFCPLRTVYFKASEALKDCINAQTEKIDFVISLGEAFCRDVKFETRAVNFMKDHGGDNDGVSYSAEVIDSSSPEYLPMTINLSSVRSKLPRKMRKYTKISKDAGTFVCNNTAYLMTRDLDIPYAFIHVPAHNCSRSNYLVERSVNILEKTIQELFN